MAVAAMKHTNAHVSLWSDSETLGFFILGKKNEKEKSHSSLKLSLPLVVVLKKKLPILKLEAHFFFSIPQIEMNISTLLKGKLRMTFSVKWFGVCK